MRMSESLLTIRDKVEYLLQKYPSTRDSDKLLWLAYLCEYHGLKTKLGPAYSILKNELMLDTTPTMESVRRVRQKHQENGKYVGEKRSYRMNEAKEVRGVLK